LDGNTTIDHNITHIRYVTSRIPNAKALKSITLPTKSTQINFFSISLVPAVTVGSESNLNIPSVRSTTKHMHSDPSLQQIEILLDSLAPLDSTNWITSSHIVTVNFSAVETVILSVVRRLRSNDQALVRVGELQFKWGALQLRRLLFKQETRQFSKAAAGKSLLVYLNRRTMTGV
jgi:alpha-L-fucosidase